MIKKKVLLLLPEGFEIFEASAFIDVIGWNLVDGDGSTELFTCGLKKEVKTTFNQRFVVDFTIESINVNDYEAFALPGGFIEFNFYDEAYSDPVLNLINDFKRKNKIIASICVGSLVLGKSGILTGKKGTTYNMKPARMETLRSYGVNVQNEPIVVDDNIITSWNPSTAIDVALLLLEFLTSKQNADFIRNIMGFNK